MLLRRGKQLTLFPVSVYVKTVSQIISSRGHQVLVQYLVERTVGAHTRARQGALTTGSTCRGSTRLRTISPQHVLPLQSTSSSIDVYEKAMIGHHFGSVHKVCCFTVAVRLRPTNELTCPCSSAVDQSLPRRLAPNRNHVSHWLSSW